MLLIAQKLEKETIFLCVKIQLWFSRRKVIEKVFHL